MTLLVAAIGSAHAAILADRKVSGPEGYTFDPTTKVFALVTQDALMIGGWTRLVSDGRAPRRGSGCSRRWPIVPHPSVSSSRSFIG